MAKSLVERSLLTFCGTIVFLLLHLVNANIPATYGASSLHLPLILKNWVPEPGPSSETLIDQAVAAGTLDCETALIY